MKPGARRLTVRVDPNGRLPIPAALRKSTGIEPGDLFFLDVEDGVLRFTATENPFDILAAHALKEYRAGRTISLRDFATENGFTLDDE